MFNIFNVVAKSKLIFIFEDYLMFVRMKVFFIGLLAIFFVLPAQAWNFGEYIDELKQNIKDTWFCGKWSVYTPVYAWHNRLTYDKEHIKKYNENPWGLGVGRSLYDGDHWHGLYAMVFKDSNDYAETFFGYGFLKNHTLDKKEHWRLGYGYTLGVTQRHEYSYVPVPVPLPIASITYKKVALQAAYVPGIKNDGNVLFAWLRWDF